MPLNESVGPSGRFAPVVFETLNFSCWKKRETRCEELYYSSQQLGSCPDIYGRSPKISCMTKDKTLRGGCWPLFGIEIAVGDVMLRPLRETDIASLVEMYPEDSEHDPGAQLWGDMNLTANRKRLFVQGYWKNWANWSPDSWCLNFRVSHCGEVVGVQSLEADKFPNLRTVDSSSWLVPEARGLGIGTAMRTAILTLAFDHLGAEVAISASHTDNTAAHTVSRRLGYIENGLSRVQSPTGSCELLHLRLDRDTWAASRHGTKATVRGLENCGTYFGVPVTDHS